MEQESLLLRTKRGARWVNSPHGIDNKMGWSSVDDKTSLTKLYRITKIINRNKMFYTLARSYVTWEKLFISSATIFSLTEAQ